MRLAREKMLDPYYPMLASNNLNVDLESDQTASGNAEASAPAVESNNRATAGTVELQEGRAARHATCLSSAALEAVVFTYGDPASWRVIRLSRTDTTDPDVVPTPLTSLPRLGLTVSSTRSTAR